MRDESSDVRRRALLVLKQAAKTAAVGAVAPLLTTLLPPAADALNDRAGPVKLLAERTVRRCCFPASDGGMEAAQAIVSATRGRGIP